MQLTTMTLSNLPVPECGRVTYRDDALPGFGIRVSASGVKSFFLMTGHARRRITLGRFPIVSLADARKRARELIAQRMLRREELPTIKFGEAVSLFLNNKYPDHAVRPKTRQRVETFMNRFFLPSLRHENVHTITAPHIARIIDRISNKPGQALNAFNMIKHFFSWAEKRQYIPRNPCALMDGPRPGKSRDRVLSKFEIKTILAYARTKVSPYATLLELLIITGQRSCEMGALRGEWIDFEKRIITFPSEFTKNKRTHVLPLGPRAFEILSKQSRIGFLFTTRGGVRPCNEWSPFKRRIDAQCKIPHWRIHDLRRTFATNLAELGIPVPVTEKLLNHVSGSTGGIVGVYQRYSYEKEARAAIELWETCVKELMAAPEVPERLFAAE